MQTRPVPTLRLVHRRLLELGALLVLLVCLFPSAALAAQRSYTLRWMAPSEPDLDGYIVYVAENNQGHYLAASREVLLGSAQGNQVVVQRGLNVGDLLITLGHHQVDNGVAIRIVNLGSDDLAGKAGFPATSPQDN